MLRVLVKSKEGKVLRGDGWYNRYTWVTVTTTSDANEAVEWAINWGPHTIIRDADAPYPADEFEPYLLY